jgi:hypothetical protein
MAHFETDRKQTEKKRGKKEKGKRPMQCCGALYLDTATIAFYGIPHQLTSGTLSFYATARLYALRVANSRPV